MPAALAPEALHELRLTARKRHLPDLSALRASCKKGRGATRAVASPREVTFSSTEGATCVLREGRRSVSSAERDRIELEVGRALLVETGSAAVRGATQATCL